MARGFTGTFLFILISAAELSIAQASGSIRATVVDQVGNPVQGATLYAHERDWPAAAIVPYCETGANGSCAISHLEFARYWVYAAKPDDGYPAVDTSFFDRPGSHPMTASLSADRPSEVLVVHLGVKAGILRGTVADAVTGKPLDANVEFRWVTDPTVFLSGSGLTTAEFRILIPSDTPLTMVVSLDGYENWVYVDPGPAKKPLLLRPGEEKLLDIRLKPKPK